jgi:hypothetical protein
MNFLVAQNIPHQAHRPLIPVHFHLSPPIDSRSRWPHRYVRRIIHKRFLWFDNACKFSGEIDPDGEECEGRRCKNYEDHFAVVYLSGEIFAKIAEMEWVDNAIFCRSWDFEMLEEGDDQARDVRSL